MSGKYGVSEIVFVSSEKVPGLVERPPTFAMGLGRRDIVEFSDCNESYCASSMNIVASRSVLAVSGIPTVRLAIWEDDTSFKGSRALVSKIEVQRREISGKGVSQVQILLRRKVRCC